jgi:hypothetical protein
MGVQGTVVITWSYSCVSPVLLTWLVTIAQPSSWGNLPDSAPRPESSYAMARMLVESIAIFLERPSVVKGPRGPLE